MCQPQVPRLPLLPHYQHPGLLRVHTWVWSKLLGGLPKQYLLNIIYLFYDFWLHHVLIAAHELSLLVASGGHSSLQSVGIPMQWLLLLWSTGSRHKGFRNWGTSVLLLLGIQDLPGLEIEPMSPALAGGFFFFFGRWILNHRDHQGSP